MANLEISPDYLETLIVKVRAVMGRVPEAIPDRGSNPTDDEAGALLESGPGDLSDDEVAKEIQGLNRTEQAELVALLWLGRGDGEAAEWEALRERARTEVSAPVDSYVLGHPLVAEFWAEGLSKLGAETGYGGVARI